MFSIFKFECKKMVYNPLSLLFSLGIPIIATIMVGIFTQSVNVPQSTIKMIDYCFPGYLMLIIFSSAGITMSMTIGNDRIEKRIKQISLSDISIIKYMFAITFFNLFFYYIGFIIMLTTAIIFFKLVVTIKTILILIFFPILNFIFIALFFLTFSNMTSTFKTLMTVVFILFYASIFLSGATIPQFVFPKWWKYFSYIFPPGLCVAIFTNLVNNISFANDWYILIIFIAYFLFFSFLAIKKFRWD